MAQNFCHVCYGTSLTFENGVLVCDTCGTQTQTYQEETEFQQGIDDTRGKRAAAGSSSSRLQLSQAALIAREEQQAAQQLKDAALLYVRCLQHLLKLQGQVLCGRFGVSGRLLSLLRQMWLSYIPLTGILEPKPQKQLHRINSGLLGVGIGSLSATAAAAGGAAAADADGDVSDGGEEGQGDQQRTGWQGSVSNMPVAQLVKPHNMQLLFWKLLHPQVTLQLCFIGCVLLREAVTFYDIMLWALDGQLPFLELPHLSMQLASEEDLQCLPMRPLQAELGLDPLAFCGCCCRLADSLDVGLPPVAAEPLLLRATKELGLPHVVYETALQLHVLHLLNTQHLRLSSSTSQARAHPYVWLAAVVMVSIKMLYGLGGPTGQHLLLPKAPGPPAGWQQWAHQVVTQLPGISYLPLTETEAVALGPGELRRYMQFCRQYMFAGQPVVTTMEDVQRLLAGWYDAADPFKTAEAPGAADDEAGIPAGAASTMHSQEAITQQQRQRQQMQKQPEHIWLEPMTAQPSNYGLFSSGQVWGSGNVRMDPELAAVVVAVAGYARVSPALLLECVKKVEKQMVAVESGVKLMERMTCTNAGGAQHL